MRCALAAILLALVFVPQAAMAELVEWRCQFDRYASLGVGAFDASSAELDDAKNFALVFVVDLETGSSYVVGNIGATEVELRFVGEDGGVVFLETAPLGSIQVTAIDSYGNAVHSRHTMMLGELVPSQYYGHCIAR